MQSVLFQAATRLVHNQFQGKSIRYAFRPKFH